MVLGINQLLLDSASCRKQNRGFMKNRVFEFLSRCWRWVATVIGTIAIISGVLTIPTYVATPADLNKLKNEVKTEVTGTIVEFKKSMELDRDITRLNQINDTLIKARIQQRQYPKDKDIAEDVENLKKDKALLESKIKGR